MRKPVNRSLLVILITVTLDSVGIGLVLPVLPALLRELSHEVNVAGHFGYFLAVYALMQFIFSPILGALSDQYGRRPVLLVSLAGAAVDYTLMAFAPNLSVLYIGRVVAGITGANMAVATAYLADISTEDERAQRYGYMNACFGIGFVAGPMLGGLVGVYSTRYPFLAAALFNGLNFLLGLFLLPESHLAERKSIELTHLNPLKSLRWVFSIRAILPFLTVYTIVCCVGQVPSTIWVIYGETRFGWNPWMVGLSFSVFGILFALAQAFLTGWTTKRWGERKSLLLALISDNSGFVLMALATQGWMVFPIMILLATGGIAMPALQSLLTRQVGEDKQGELQGTLVSIMSVTAVIGPIVVTKVYALSEAFWPGFVWLCGAIFYTLCFPVLRMDTRSSREESAPVTA